MNKIDIELLEKVTDLHGVPQGSYSIRKNGEVVDKASSKEIEIRSKQNKNGVDIYVAAGVKNKSLHLPVIITVGGINDLVYNDFYIGENADVLIVAGCGIHNSSSEKSQHEGIHRFYLEKGSKVRYFEKHLGVGTGSGEKVLNPCTKIQMKADSVFEMETYQLGGVSYSNRKTYAKLGDNTKLVIKEKVLTDNNQEARTYFDVTLVGKNSSVEVISRSVAKGESTQKFVSNLKGKNECFGHVECDGILLDKARIESTPKIVAESIDATLVHEAAIGKIAGEQLIKLQTLGLAEEDAQKEIIKGFLK